MKSFYLTSIALPSPREQCGKLYKAVVRPLSENRELHFTLRTSEVRYKPWHFLT